MQNKFWFYSNEIWLRKILKYFHFQYNLGMAQKIPCFLPTWSPFLSYLCCMTNAKLVFMKNKTLWKSQEILCVHLHIMQYLYSGLEDKTSMKWISYQISTSYNELYLINSGISGRERERERDEFCVIDVKCKEISWRVRRKKERKEK